jgi:hypothetical protein
VPNRKNKRKISRYVTLPNIILSFIIIILAVFGGYLTISKNDLQEQTEKFKKEITKLKQQQAKFLKEQEEQVAKYFEEKTKDLEIEYSKPIDNQQYIEHKKEEDTIKFVYDDTETKKKDTFKDIKQDDKKEEVAVLDKKIRETVEKEIPKGEQAAVKKDLPKLAIIIDDVTTSGQIKKIQDIGYAVNMSFLPPTPRHKNSAKVAQKLDNYMIHLPLQASSFKYEEENTLYINDSIGRIQRRIDTLSRLYPKAKYINNHTGSKFTADKEAMDRLFSVLKKYDYIFIDSKTTAKSVAKESGKKHGLRVLSRNIFLDNKKDKEYIQGQLEKAVKIAKKYGSAIAIGHPYGITFQALKDSKHLLEGLEMVYVDKL